MPGKSRREFVTGSEFFAIVVAAAAAAVEASGGLRSAEGPAPARRFARQDGRRRLIDRFDADGHVAQHVLIEAELAFHFGDERGLRVEAEQHVVALPVLLDPVGQAAQAPVFPLLDLAALGGEVAGDVVGDRLDLLLRDVVPRDEHGFVKRHMRSLWLVSAQAWIGPAPGWRVGIAGALPRAQTGKARLEARIGGRCNGFRGEGGRVSVRSPHNQ